MSTHPDKPLLANQPTLCTASHSILQQERLYLLRALADEERRKERLTSTLKKIQGSLDLATSEPIRQTKVLRKKLRVVRSKLNRCKGTRRALCNNLDALTVQMHRLDDHQWRRTHHDYAQQTQHGLMASLSPTRASVAIVNPPPMQQFRRDTMPISPFETHQYQPVVQQPFTNPMEQALMSPIPPTPILRPVQYPNRNTNLNPFSFSSPPPRRQQQSTSILRTNINPLCPSGPSSPFSLSYNFNSLSPTDTISTYSLNPNPNPNQSTWIPPAAPYPSPTNWDSNTTSNSFVPPSTQVFDLVQGLGTMSLSSRRENQNQNRYRNRNLVATGLLSPVWVCAPPQPPPQLSPLLSAPMAVAMAMASSPRGAEMDMHMQDVGVDVDMGMEMEMEMGRGYGFGRGYGYTPSHGYGYGYGHE